MKVSLVYVGVGVAGFVDKRGFGDREGVLMSHGVASIGASVKQAGYDVDLIDLRTLTGFEEFKRVIQRNPADVYGLSISAVDYYAGIMTAYQIHLMLPEAKIIVGGIHPTVFPEQYDYPMIDTVVTGEGEITFVDLLTDIELGKELPRRVKGKKPNLTLLPWVDRELFDYRKELELPFVTEQGVPSVTMLAGRGCPYHCNYCQPAENAIFGKPYRLREVEGVIAELRQLKEKYAFNSITFWDDTFTFNRRWINEFCDQYEHEQFNAQIVACSRSDIICDNEQMIARLSDIGTVCLVIGFESGSQRILDFLNKGTTVSQNLKAAHICHKYGIKVFATFMLGIPTETNEEALQTMKMLDMAEVEMPSAFYYTPIPGTGLYKYCEDNDLILDEMKNRTIARTGLYFPTIKGPDYDYIYSLLSGNRGLTV